MTWSALMDTRPERKSLMEAEVWGIYLEQSRDLDLDTNKREHIDLEQSRRSDAWKIVRNSNFSSPPLQ